MTITQSECFIELSNFDDLARYACAFREYPRRVYSQEFNGSRIISVSLTLSNTLLIFMPKCQNLVGIFHIKLLQEKRFVIL